ncbi:MAG TPA: carboxymuconolactone decarboxylase family protein [Mycobacteriales bacterium]|nr:carboxymuconolactone decarboxylase family protein [Mycobacteriales bacterium]
MAIRVPKATLPADFAAQLAEQFGAVPEPLEVTWNHPEAAQAFLELGGKVNGWTAADAGLKSFAHMAVAAYVGCSWCLDVGYFQALNQNLDLTKASQVPRWREADVFTPLERDVMAYAEAMTDTPTTVTDELSARLLEELGAEGLVELTVLIAFANASTRSNTALGVTSQGFSDACEVPLAGRPGVASPA